MAKTVGDLLIKLKSEGIENVTALKSALRALGQATSASDKQLEDLRKEITNVAKASNLSRQSIRGQIDAFKGLKQQATIGSTVYKKLGKDIDNLTESLDRLNRKEEEAAKKPRTAKQIFGEGVAVVPEKFSRQIAAGNEILQKLKVTSSEYGSQLASITARTQEFTRAQQRQQVVAQNLVATNRAQTTGFLQSTKVNIENTHTTAALKQKIAELAQDLDNIDVGSKEYISTSNRLKDAQEELNVVLGISRKAFDELSLSQERAERRAKKLADIQRYYGTSRTGEGQAAQRAGGFRDPVTGAMIARGTRAGRVSLAQQPMREISSLYRSIGDVGMSGISADIDRMGKSYQEVANDIREATLASNGSISSLQAQRASWAQLRAGLDPASKAYQNVGREIEKVDRRLEKLNKRRRLTLGGAASALGGIAAGGVFGGPEGAIGGAIGGAVGGLPGVAAGAALGAQVKMLREALGATSDYAAELQKLEIALQGVAGASYTDALKAAGEVTKELNVPQEVAIRGMTRLSAAVIGAGGNVADAEVVFRNITSAIKATGGGAQDVESAITAMVQTFSKGKVSAEELSGQLGERLPGAVTKFAEANNMTLPELQKAFKAGTVGLNELMTFIISLGPEYAETARKIADSSADAGARAQVAFNEVRIAVGEALQPIGAQLQVAFAEFITDILPALVVASKAAAAGINKLLDVAAFLTARFEELASAALILGSAVGAAGLAKAATTAGGAMNALKVALFDARLAVAGLGKAIGFLMANPVVLLVAGVTAAGVALYRAATANDRFVKSIDDGTTTLEEAKDKAEDLNSEINKMQERLDKTSNNRLIQSLRRQLAGLYDDLEDVNNAIERAIYREFGGGKDFVGPVIPGMRRQDELPDPELTKFAPPVGDDGKGSDKQKVLMSEAELQIRRQIRDAIKEENLVKESVARLNLDLLKASEETEDAVKRTNMQEKARFDNGQRLKKLFDDQLKVQRDLQASLEDRQYKLGLITEQEYINLQIARERRKLVEQGASDEMTEKTLAALRQELDPDFATSINKELAEMRRNFEKLIDPANQVIGAANAIGDAFSKSFQNVITGQATAREALAGFFKSVADHFIDMATEIIAHAIKMQAIQIISQIIGSAVSAGVPGPGSTGVPGLEPNSYYGTGGRYGSFVPPKLNADGNYLPGGFKAFSQGGVASQPTLGMVGEGGEPEYIIPQSKMRESMARYSRGVRGPGVIPDSPGSSASNGGGSIAGAPIDVRFKVERINSVDYVTAQEFQAGMQQAASQGAREGEQRAMRKLQTSSATRRRLAV